MTSRRIIQIEHKVEPNLRKLARALIALAELRLAATQANEDQANEVVKQPTGDAA